MTDLSSILDTSPSANVAFGDAHLAPSSEYPTLPSDVTSDHSPESSMEGTPTTRPGSDSSMRLSGNADQSRPSRRFDYLKLKEIERMERDGETTAETVDTSTGLDLSARAARNVKRHWENLGIWRPEWEDTEIAEKDSWKHEDPIEHKPASFSMRLNIFRTTYDPRGAPAATEEQKATYERETAASRPFNQFKDEVRSELGRLGREKVNTRDQDLQVAAFEAVQRDWVREGVWSSVWDCNLLPGRTWTHEDVGNDGDAHRLLPEQYNHISAHLNPAAALREIFGNTDNFQSPGGNGRLQDADSVMLPDDNGLTAEDDTVRPENQRSHDYGGPSGVHLPEFSDVEESPPRAEDSTHLSAGRFGEGSSPGPMMTLDILASQAERTSAEMTAGRVQEQLSDINPPLPESTDQALDKPVLLNTPRKITHGLGMTSDPNVTLPEKSPGIQDLSRDSDVSVDPRLLTYEVDEPMPQPNDLSDDQRVAETSVLQSSASQNISLSKQASSELEQNVLHTVRKSRVSKPPSAASAKKGRPRKSDVLHATHGAAITPSRTKNANATKPSSVKTLAATPASATISRSTVTDMKLEKGLKSAPPRIPQGTKPKRPGRPPIEMPKPPKIPAKAVVSTAESVFNRGSSGKRSVALTPDVKSAITRTVLVRTPSIKPRVVQPTSTKRELLKKPSARVPSARQKLTETPSQSTTERLVSTKADDNAPSASFAQPKRRGRPPATPKTTETKRAVERNDIDTLVESAPVTQAVKARTRSAMDKFASPESSKKSESKAAAVNAATKEQASNEPPRKRGRPAPKANITKAIIPPADEEVSKSQGKTRSGRAAKAAAERSNASGVFQKAFREPAKKRGRPAGKKAIDVVEEPVEASIAENTTASRKRGRQLADLEPAEKSQRKRGRPTAAKEKSNPKPRGRGRPAGAATTERATRIEPKKRLAGWDATVANEIPIAEHQTRKRGRVAAKSATEPDIERLPKKRGREAIGEIDLATEVLSQDDAPPPKKRGRPVGTTKNEATKITLRKQSAAKKLASGATAPATAQPDASLTEAGPAPKKRGRPAKPKSHSEQPAADQESPPEPTTGAAVPTKRRGRPPMNNASTCSAEKVEAKKSSEVKGEKPSASRTRKGGR